MAWMHRAAPAAHLSPEDLVKQLSQPPVQVSKGRCMALQLLVGSRFIYLLQPRAAHAKAGPEVCSNIKVRGYCTGLQYHEWMCESASKPTVLFLSHPRNNRPPNGGNRSQDETNRRWQFFRQEAVGLQGSVQSAYMDSRVDKKSMCRRDPLIATKQTNHTRLRKSPWAGNSARRYHMHLPCFFSSRGTYGYYWKQDTRQDGAVPWTSTAVLTT